MGPANRRSGWGRRARTPITGARTRRPTIRRSPSNHRCDARLDHTALERSTHGELQGTAGAKARHAAGRDRDQRPVARVPAAPGDAAGDHERPESADGDGAALTQRLAHGHHEGAERAIGRGARATGRTRQHAAELRARHADGAAALTTRYTASSNVLGLNGFSTTGMSVPSRNAHAPSVAVSPVMKMKRRPWPASRATALR